MPYFMDYWYIILVLPTILLALFAQAKVKSAFNTYSSLIARNGKTAASVTRQILDSNGLFNVRIERTSGHLSDHFDPKNNVIRLSESVYDSGSVAAIGVAAHEAGHAVQHAEKYVPIKIRNAIIPVANLGSSFAPIIIILGIVLSSPSLVWFGIILYSSIAAFQLVTLPLEFNASKRAVATLNTMGFDEGEITGVKKVLSAAALTYVAALLTTLANLLRFILISRRNSRR